jgi:hypothetical protein
MILWIIVHVGIAIERLRSLRSEWYNRVWAGPAVKIRPAISSQGGIFKLGGLRKHGSP